MWAYYGNTSIRGDYTASAPGSRYNSGFTMPARSGPRLHYYAAICLLPIVVLWRRDDALFSPLWYADTWFYLGYFRDLVNFKSNLFHDFYYGSRLSWILAGYISHW